MCSPPQKSIYEEYVQVNIFCDKYCFYHIVLRKAKIVYNFGLSERNRVKDEFTYNSKFKACAHEVVCFLSGKSFQ